MRWECNFEHKDSGQVMSLQVKLDPDEMRAVDYVRAITKPELRDEQATLIAQSYALSHAYKQVPNGFLHSAPPRRILDH